MRVTIELTDAEAKHLRSYCILRGVQGALNCVPLDWDYYDEVLEAAEIYERLRSRLVSAIHTNQMQQHVKGE